MIGDIQIQEGWLKVQKIFKDEYAKSEEVAVTTDSLTAVMLHTVMDDNLKNLGLSREITNKI